MKKIEKLLFVPKSSRVSTEIQRLHFIERFRKVFNPDIEKHFYLKVDGICFRCGSNEFETIRRAKLKAHKIMLVYGKRHFQILHKGTNILVYSE